MRIFKSFALVLLIGIAAVGLNINTAKAVSLLNLNCPATNQSPLNCGGNLFSGALEVDTILSSISGPVGFVAINDNREARASYDNGRIKLLSDSDGNFIGTPASNHVAGSILLDDVIITSSDSNAMEAQISLNVDLAGMSAQFATNFGFDAVELDFSLHIAGNPFNGRYQRVLSYTGAVDDTVTGLATQIAGGSYSDDFSTTITTETVTVAVDMPFSVFLEFAIYHQTLNASRGVIEAVFNFPTFGNVFNLEEGFNANSASGLIVNNMSPGAVPLPAALPLYGTGLAVMGFLGWRRKRQALRD